MSFIKVCKNKYCFIGPQGPTGETGPQGPQNGPRGITGSTGPKGARNNYGPTGDKGPTGERGDSGKAGAMIVRQIGAPTLLPNNEGIVVSNDIDSGDIYYYTSGNWIGIGNNKGPTGPVGVRGPTVYCDNNSYFYTILGGTKITTGSTNLNVYTHLSNGDIDGVLGAVYRHNTNTNFYEITSRIDLNVNTVGVGIISILYEFFTQSQTLILSKSVQKCVESDNTNLTLSTDFTINNPLTPILLPNTNYYLVVSWKVNTGSIGLFNSGNHLNISVSAKYKNM